MERNKYGLPVFGGMGGSSIPGMDSFGMGGPSGQPGPTAGPGASASDFTAFGPGGGMDVMGSLKKNSDFATGQMRQNGGGGAGGLFGGGGFSPMGY